ncbi:MAG: c-type cytochrome [Gemmatimonadota bacterium]
MGRVAGMATVACLLGVGPLVAQQEGHPGKPVYDRWCAGCHGVDGQGQGPAAAYMLPRPRDFTQALYQIRTTASGSIPTDADIRKIIDEGMPGTAMPGWEEALSSAERDALVDYLKTFSRYFETDEPRVLEFGGAPGVSDELLEAGREAYQTLECFKCHGQAGRGDGASAPTQADADDFPVRPADLTQPWLFSGGASVEEIYRRFLTGLDGTPMPSYADVLEAGVVTEEQLWGLAHYVRALGGDAPRVREVVAAARVEDVLPTAADDAAWEDAERFWIPLAGQIIEEPRWFAPAVTGVWVQALHDGRELALRVSWNDRSESPDPEWAGWRDQVNAIMAPGAGEQAGGEASDGMAVWFPPPDARDRPYFLMGSERAPVRVWHWDSRSGAVERLGRGLGNLESLPADEGALQGQAEFDQGRWSVLLRRPLLDGDSAAATLIPAGQPVPMAFMVWDGDNAEAGTRGAVSSWYYVQLTEPTPPTVYALPVLAVLLTAALGLLVVRRAQRRVRTPAAAPAAA